jgi:myosin-1
VESTQEWSRGMGTCQLVRANIHRGMRLTVSLKLVESAPPPPAPAAPRRAPPPVATSNGLKPNGLASTGSTPANSRPTSMIGNKGPPPAPKPKPKPSIPAKPSVGAKPAAPAATLGGSSGPKPPGQMDLAAALAKRAQRAQEE